MNDSFLISVVVPTYKRSQWLYELLLSMEQQTLPKNQFEVIVVDDETPDPEGQRKKELIESKKWEFSLTYLIQDKKGPAAARNVGIRQAKASWIAFTDDDALPESRWLETFSKSLSNEALAFSGMTKSSHIATLTEKYLDEVKHLSVHHIGEDGTLAYIITVNACFSKKILLDIGGFDETFPYPSGEDMDLGFRLRERGVSFKIVEDAVVYHRHRSSFLEMTKTWFIYGRGAYQCAKKNAKHLHKGVTSDHFNIVSKTIQILASSITSTYKNARKLGLLKSLLFQFFEISNHIAYQMGRVTERLFVR
ncbi:MAG: glycosyltransferase [Bdellovibrionota bacterium]